MQRVLFVCVREEKTQNIEPNETKSQYLICSYLQYGTREYFNSLCKECATWLNPQK